MDLSQFAGQPILLPNYEPWTSVSVVNSLTTNVTTVAKRRIAFETAEYDIRVLFSGANVQGICGITLPTGDVIDTSLYADPATFNLEPVGAATIVDASALSRMLGNVFLNGTANVRVYTQLANVGGTFVASTPLLLYNDLVDTSTNKPVTFAAGDELRIYFKVPLVRLAGGYSIVNGGVSSSLPSLVAGGTESGSLNVPTTGPVSQNILLNYVRNGKQVTLQIDQNVSFTATSTASIVAAAAALPVSLRPIGAAALILPGGIHQQAGVNTDNYYFGIASDGSFNINRGAAQAAWVSGQVYVLRKGAVTYMVA